jgi:hypothetical protein
VVAFAVPDANTQTDELIDEGRLLSRREDPTAATTQAPSRPHQGRGYVAALSHLFFVEANTGHEGAGFSPLSESRGHSVAVDGVSGHNLSNRKAVYTWWLGRLTIELLLGKLSELLVGVIFLIQRLLQ